jgi:RimJ/RimL family protein N-acetyltransferase
MSELISGDLFTGKLVRLTAPRPEDKDAMARWTQDAEYLRQLDADAARPRSADFFVEDKDKARERESRFFEFRVRTLADDKLIGFTELGIGWNTQAAWFGIGIGEAEYRGKGYGTDAVRLTVGYAFRELGLYRIGLTVFSYNPRAIRCYEKAGFVHEGVMRAALYRDGQRHDQLFMGLLRPEWDQQQAELQEKQAGERC